MPENDYIKIDWPDVQAGDVLMHENGDRLTVVSAERATETREPMGVARCYTSVELPTGWMAGPDELEEAGFSPYRKAEPVPTQPGAYLDKDGNPWLCDETGDWHSGEGYIYSPRAESVRASAPFTRLVPMPSREALGEAIGGEVATDAVMALLSGDANSTEVEG